MAALDSDVLTDPAEPDELADAPPGDAEPGGATEPSRRSWWARAGMRIIRRPYRWATAPWPDDRIVRTAVTVSTLVVTTFIMMRIVHFNPLDLIGLGENDLIFLDSTPTGGDMGAHVWGPAYLRDVLLPSGQLSGWSMDWYAGLPVYRFYMVVPALAIVALDVVLPYGVAFKLVAISGVVSLPACCWGFGRLARFRYPMPELFAFAALCFLLNESYDIYGGNVLSTMAGEFSFSIAVSFMMLGLGALCRGLDEGRYMAWASVLLALACLCHGIVLIYTMVGALIIVACRCGADLWRVFTKVVNEPAPEQRRRIVYALLVSPAVIALTVLLAQAAAELYVLTFLACVAAVVLLVILCIQVGWAVPENRLFVKRVIYGSIVGGLTIALSAFWVGPFLFNHEYMTDMKYGFRPQGAGDSFWGMLFDQKPAINFIVNGLAIFGFAMAILRRHVYGVALGVMGVVAVALVYLTRDSLPVINLLWNPRVLPWLYLVRYLLMMVGAAELGSVVVNVVRNRPARTVGSVGVNSIWMAVTALTVLLIFGWVYQVLPGGERVQAADGTKEYVWGPFSAPTVYDNWDRARGWTSYNFTGYEDRPLYPEYHDLMATMTALGESDGCGRALWERLDSGYGTSMALMLLPFWTDGCIQSSEGLFFEASGTTPYHFIAADAMSSTAYTPVRQIRETINDASVGVPYVQALGIRYVMLTTPAAVAEADAQPELHKVATSGPWHIYSVDDSEVVVPLGVEPVVVNPREGDQRECFLELGTSWFQNPSEWAALPATNGPAEWQRIDVVIDPARQDPPEQGTEGCGDPDSSPSRRVNVVMPGDPIEPVALPAIEVTNIEMGDQSIEFDVSEPGVPVLVKVSYFPNFQATGADGPYRVAPNFMVVVPTDNHVKLEYGRSSSDLVFMAMTGLGIAGAIVARVKGPIHFPELAPAAGAPPPEDDDPIR
jgi:hypothetical protein